MSIFLDAHVHIHHDFPLEELFDAALFNFHEAAAAAGDSESRDYVLLLTENVGVNVFSKLQSIAESDVVSPSAHPSSSAGRWQYHTVGEPNCLLARNRKEESLYIFAGLQLISSEELEVLSLCATLNCANRTFSLEDMITQVWEAGGVAVVPWGVGKWMGRRGAVLDTFIHDGHRYPVILGDNGNRPMFWPYPKYLAAAEQKGWPIISGSDPLPVAGHHRRVGTYGTWVAGRRLDGARPVTDIKSILTSADGLKPFGKKAGVFHFLRDQLLVNMRKRLPKIF